MFVSDVSGKFLIPLMYVTSHTGFVYIMQYFKIMMAHLAECMKIEKIGNFDEYVRSVAARA